MKKIFILALVAGLSVGSALMANGTGPAPKAVAPTQEYVVGGFEASGHIFAGYGWQRFKTNGGLAITNGSTVPFDIRGSYPGVLGEYYGTDPITSGAVPGGINREDFAKFFLDEIELDIAKTFGENIRVRGDFDFGSAQLFSGPRFNVNSIGSNGAAAGDSTVGVVVEQAYVTANLGFGDGLELLLGRFNSPLGFESVDTIANDTISRSIIFRAIRPISYTGLKLYYRFNDTFDWAMWGANNPMIHDTGDTVIGAATDVPLAGTRFGFHWGEDSKSYAAIGGAWGQDHPNVKNGWSWFGSADFNVWVTDDFRIGGEGIVRYIDTITPAVAGALNGKYLGGLANLHYNFSDVWDGTLRYSYVLDSGVALANTGILVTPLNGAANQTLTGLGGVFYAGGAVGQQFHEFVLAANYVITEGAKLRLEGGYTIIDPAFPNNFQHVFGVAGAFGYEF